MRSKKSNSTRGRGTSGSRDHGQDLGPAQRKHSDELKKFSAVKGFKTVRIPTPGENEREAFPSSFQSLRKGVKDNFGYRIPRLVPDHNGGEVALPEHRGKKPKKRRRGRPQKITEAYRVIAPGEPDIDAGVDGWIKPENTNDFVTLGNRMDSLLETFNRLENVKIKTQINGKEIVEIHKKLKTRKAEALRLEDQGSGEAKLVEGNAATVSMRDTLIASPFVSRAIQRMIEDGFLEEAKQALEAAMEPLGREYESIFRGAKTTAKLTSMVPHVGSGHFHYDCWVHSTYLGEAEIGPNRELMPVRLWDPRALSHHGPGPGVTFWTRHFDVLGDLEELAKTEPEAAEIAGYTKMICDQALSGCQTRAEDAYKKAISEKDKVEAEGGVYSRWIRPADDFARDIRITRAIDRILAIAIGDLGLEKDYVEMGREEYRKHLIDAYKSGTTGVRMETPEKLETVKKLAERAEKRVREAGQENREVLVAIKNEKKVAQKLKREAEALVRKAVSDKAALKVEAEGLRAKTVSSALAQVFREFFPKQKPVKQDEIGLRQEIVQKLANFVRRGFQSALQSLFPDRKLVGRSSKEMSDELKAAAVEFRVGAEVAVVDAVLGNNLESLRAAGKNPVEELKAELARLQESEKKLRDFAKLVVPPKGAASKLQSEVVKLLEVHDRARGRSVGGKKDEGQPGGLG